MHQGCSLWLLPVRHVSYVNGIQYLCTRLTSSFQFYTPSGVRGSLFVLAGINCLGFLFTFLIPETNNKSLEELNGEAETDEGDEEDRAARREGPSKAGETGIVELNEVDVKSY